MQALVRHGLIYNEICAVHDVIRCTDVIHEVGLCAWSYRTCHRIVGVTIGYRIVGVTIGSGNSSTGSIKKQYGCSCAFK